MPEAGGGNSEGPIFFSSGLAGFAFFLRDQFFKLAKPFLNHVLG
jgi:hypothetical protein